jgi:hypothetical protein
MGGALQRLEILLIGLILLLAGVVAIFLTFIRPPSPAAYIPTTPLPIATSAAATIVVTQPMVTQPAATPLQPTVAATESTAPAQLALPTIQLHASSPALWPQLLFGAAAIGVALTIRQWRRRGATLKMPKIRLPRLALPTIHAPRLTLPTRSASTATPPELLAPPIVAPRSDERETPAPTWLIEPVETIDAQEESAPAISAPVEPVEADEPIEFPVLAEIAEPVEQAVAGTLSESGAIADNMPSSLGIIVGEQPDPPALQDFLVAQTVDIPAAQPELVQETPQVERPVTWSAEDRVLATAAALATIWNIEGISSPVRSFDTAKADGAHAVLANIDIHADDEAAILNLPQLLNAQQPKWRVSWRQDALSIEMPTDGPPPSGGPLIVPILDHGRRLRTKRFYPLATWRHLAIYGANALHTLHALLSSMIYAQPPSNLALAILDQGEITPLYRDVPHLVTPPGDTHITLEALASALRRSSARTIRPLALVMVEPDSTVLARLHALLLRLRIEPLAPIHLITTQTQLHSAGREIYALLPALITAGGIGSYSWLPGQGDWPKGGAARLAGRGMLLEGRPYTMDESEVAATLALLHGGTIGELPPVLWDSIPTTYQVIKDGLKDEEAALCG